MAVSCVGADQLPVAAFNSTDTRAVVDNPSADVSSSTRVPSGFTINDGDDKLLPLS